LRRKQLRFRFVLEPRPLALKHQAWSCVSRNLDRRGCSPQFLLVGCHATVKQIALGHDATQIARSEAIRDELHDGVACSLQAAPTEMLCVEYEQPHAGRRLWDLGILARWVIRTGAERRAATGSDERY